MASPAPLGYSYRFASLFGDLASSGGSGVTGRGQAEGPSFHRGGLSLLPARPDPVVCQQLKQRGRSVVTASRR